MQFIESATVILLLILTQINGKQVVISNCGQRIPAHRQLITNSSATSYWPWHAAIYHKNSNNVPEYKCGGSIVSSKFILTAGHCVSRNSEPMETAKVSVSLGRLNLGVNEGSSQSFEVAKIILHSKYSAQDSNNDIAMIRLATDAFFNNYVQPVCLWHANKKELSEVVGREGTVVGWGYTESGEASNVLREALMPVVDSWECLDTLRSFFGFYLRKTNFCAGLRNGTSVCEGDSGGSMTFEENGIFYIRGIVSVSPAINNKKTQKIYCDSYNYAIFTDVAQYLPWIDEVTSGLIPDIEECEKRVQCHYSTGEYGEHIKCNVHTKISRSEQNCKIIFYQLSDLNVTWVNITGESDVFPDLSDAINKFRSLVILNYENSKLKVIERSKVRAFGRIKALNLAHNEIFQVSGDTFMDLKELINFHLDYNKLREVHRNLFSEHGNLKSIFLSHNQIQTLSHDLFRNNRKLWQMEIDHNQLKELHPDLLQHLDQLALFRSNDNQIEILPEGLFRNNRKLKKIWLQNNKLKTIKSEFQHLTNLVGIDFEGNICIDEFCQLLTNGRQCGKEIQEIINTRNC